MPVIYATPVKAARMTATRDYFAGGTLEILSAGDQVLAIFALTETGGSVTGPVWTLDFEEWTVPGEAGIVGSANGAKARLKNAAGEAHQTGLTVGLPGSTADLKLINVAISSGQPVIISSATYTHAADPS